MMAGMRQETAELFRWWWAGRTGCLLRKFAPRAGRGWLGPVARSPLFARAPRGRRNSGGTGDWAVAVRPLRKSSTNWAALAGSTLRWTNAVMISSSGRSAFLNRVASSISDRRMSFVMAVANFCTGNREPAQARICDDSACGAARPCPQGVRTPKRPGGSVGMRLRGSAALRRVFAYEASLRWLMRKTAPRGSLARHSTSQPCASTICWTTAKPKPVPFVCVVK